MQDVCNQWHLFTTCDLYNSRAYSFRHWHYTSNSKLMCSRTFLLGSTGARASRPLIYHSGHWFTIQAIDLPFRPLTYHSGHWFTLTINSRRVVATTKIPLIDWTSDTRSQGYTNLQSLVKRLDHRDIASDTACRVKQGCYRLRDALKCISEATTKVTDVCS